jgi:hypothetical protein
VGLVHTSLARIQSWPTVEVISSRSPLTFRFLAHGDGCGLRRHESREVALTVIFHWRVAEPQEQQLAGGVTLVWSEDREYRLKPCCRFTLGFSVVLMWTTVLPPEMVLGHHAGGSAAPGPVNGDSDYNVQPRLGCCAWPEHDRMSKESIYCTAWASHGSLFRMVPRLPCFLGD